MNKKFLGLASAAAIGLASLAPVNANAASVELELALLIDVSGSVDANEYNLQRQGYVLAFQDAAVQNAIANLTGGLAVTFIQWSSGNEQQQSLGWTTITNATEANAFAAAIGGVARAFTGLTAPGSALNFATPLFNNGIDSLRQVIDVSGDGSQNDGANTAAARTAALTAGIDAINGLPILGSESGLLAWYQNNIQGGANGFTLAANSFAEFDAAIKAKLFKEITQTPEPGSLVLLGLGLLGLGASRRRKAA